MYQRPSTIPARSARIATICILLSALVFAVFWPAIRNGFVEYDDPGYVTDNHHVQTGLTLANVAWAFGTAQQSNWHPVTWLSHMADCQVFGLRPWGHHFTNVTLHALNTVLLFLLLRGLTAATWPSFFPAALFGLHPLRVESVAWVSERKDVLSMFFLVLTLLAYVKYARARRQKTGGGARVEGRGSRQGTPRNKGQGTRSALPAPRFSLLAPCYYALALFFFVLGLMSKPMLVSLPFVLLLLDFWPLGRVRSDEWRVTRVGAFIHAPRLFRLALEKLPFLVLSAASCIVTLAVQKRGGALIDLQRVPLEFRVENALVSYCRYLGKLFWPANLDIFYPLPKPWPGVIVAGAGLLLAGISLLAWLRRRREPWLFAGWWWFVLTLVPVIGLVQVGSQAMADRYTYLPSIGILLIVVWGAYHLWQSRSGRTAAIIGATAAVLACIPLTHNQLGYWRNTESLCRHSLALTPNNYFFRNLLGLELLAQNRTDEAIGEFQQSIQARPEDPAAYDFLGRALLARGKVDEAIGLMRRSLALNPRPSSTHRELAEAFMQKGEEEQALIEFEGHLQAYPYDAQARGELGALLLTRRQYDSAITELEQAVKLNPSSPESYNNLAIALSRSGRVDEAIIDYKEALRLKPHSADTHFNLGLALSRRGRREEAIGHFKQALQLQPGFAAAQRQLEALQHDTRGTDIAKANPEEGASGPKATTPTKPAPSHEALQAASKPLNKPGTSDKPLEKVQTLAQGSYPRHHGCAGPAVASEQRREERAAPGNRHCRHHKPDEGLVADSRHSCGPNYGGW
jgi:tetratricopeptide (TPR) repeat protein